MLQSRRGFLIGVCSLLTAAFVKEARSFIRTSGRPLLARPEQVAQTLYWYEDGGEGHLLTLGAWAKAYCLLEKIDFGLERVPGRVPHLEFYEGASHPGDTSRWVNAKDQLSLSLLQVRLIDLKMPIRIAEGR